MDSTDYSDKTQYGGLIIFFYPRFEIDWKKSKQSEWN